MQLRIYRRDAASGALALEEIRRPRTPRRVIPNVDEDGVVWIAGASEAAQLVCSPARFRANARSTQVLRFDPRIAKPAMGKRRLASPRSISIRRRGDFRRHRGRPWRDEFLIGARSTRRYSSANRTRESPTPSRGLRPGALLVSGAINLLGALLVILAMPGVFQRHAHGISLGADSVSVRRMGRRARRQLTVPSRPHRGIAGARAWPRVAELVARAIRGGHLVPGAIRSAARRSAHAVHAAAELGNGVTPQFLANGVRPRRACS